MIIPNYLVANITNSSTYKQKKIFHFQGVSVCILFLFNALPFCMLLFFKSQFKYKKQNSHLYKVHISFNIRSILSLFVHFCDDSSRFFLSYDSFTVFMDNLIAQHTLNNEIRLVCNQNLTCESSFSKSYDSNL